MLNKIERTFRLFAPFTANVQAKGKAKHGAGYLPFATVFSKNL